MSFVSVAKNKSNMKLTENGAVAYKSTKSDLLDLYGVVGACRTRSDADIIDMFEKAYKENPEYTKKLVLYARNIREGGLGERRVGKILLKRLAIHEPNLIKNNFDTIVTNGRFDDLYVFDSTSLENEMYKFISNQLVNDINGMLEKKGISQMAKWLKSINTSSKVSKKLGKKTASKLGLSEKEYRKTLSSLREYLNVVEQKMCSNKWNTIDYKSVPSVCMNRNMTNFFKHDLERMTEYKNSLVRGETKVNASTLFPYDITEKMLYQSHSQNDIDVLEEQWKAMPNYFSDGFNIVTMADVSGSMMGKPMATSIGMAIYCAQHNVGPYSELFMTFTNRPHFETIKKDGKIRPKINEIKKYCGYNTNLDGALEEVLRVARESGESPDALLIVSDSEIDKFSRDFNFYGKGIVDKYVNKFESNGLKMPVIVFWNVEARQNTFLATAENPYVRFISGQSASNFANLETIIKRNAYQSMIEVLDKYSWK